MSEQNRGSLNNKVISLVSDRDSYHTTLVRTFINDNIAPCSLVKSSQDIDTNTELVLLDCFQAPIDKLNKTLKELSTSAKEFPTALLNAEAKEEHENLLDWPCTSGLFYLDNTEEQLKRGIETLLEGDFWVPRRLLHHFFDKHRQSSNKSQVNTSSTIQLTNREKEILRMIKDGMSNSAVSASLDLSEHTVKSHLYNIYKKIGVRNRMEASNWARGQQGLDIL